MKKFLLSLFLLISTLLADTYMTLDNGKTVLLKDDGTWEEVKIVKKGDKTIALKKDGTWEEITPKSVESANLLTNEADQKFKDTKLGKALLGKWKSEDGDEYLVFTKKRATYKKRLKNGFKTITGKWIIEKMDEKSRRVVVNIGEGARLGFLTFGGIIRKLRFGNSLDTLYDESDKLSEMKVYTLHKIK